jgi:hypothetical protein
MKTGKFLTSEELGIKAIKEYIVEKKYFINLYLKDKLMLRVAETFTDLKKAEKLVKELEKDNFGEKFEIKIEEVK